MDQSVMPSSFRTILLVPVVLCLAACGGEKSQPAPQVTLVKTEVAQLQPWQTVIRLTGDVQARVSTELSFRVSGRVTERLVDVGAHVKAGDVLARIDPTEQQADLAGSQAAVAAAEAQLRVATANFERQKSLIDKGFTTRVAYDQAQEALHTAEGSLETAKAQLGNATDALSYTELRASASGIITARNIEVGQVAQAAQSAYTLAEDGARDAVVDVYESIFLTPWEGRVAKLTLLSDPSVTALATPREISPTVDPKSGAVRVKMSITDPPAAMTLGSVVAAEGRSKPVQRIVLPWSALTSDAKGPAVWVVDPQSRAVSLKAIVVQTYETNSVIVASGLAPGDRVVTEGGKLLRPSQIVTYDGLGA